MPGKHFPLIMEVIDNIFSLDPRKSKYSDRQILKIFVLLQIFRISCRSSGIFLINHEEYLGMAGLKEMSGFQTLSRRASMLDLHGINREVSFLYSMKSIAAEYSFMIHTCKYSTAVRMKYWGRYKDPESEWSRAIRGGLMDASTT